MLRQFSQILSHSALLAPQLLNLSPIALCHSSRRCYITTEVYRTTSLLPDDLLNILGFSSSENPTRQQLAVAFKRELSRLVEVTRSPAEQARIDEQRGASAVIEFDAEMEKLTYKLENSADALRHKFDTNNDANTYRHDSSRKSAGGDSEKEKRRQQAALTYAVEQRISQLVDAYRSLNNSRFKYLYDSSFDAAIEVQLGYRRSDTAFANFDARRQEFFFNGSNPEQQGRALSDFSSAYKRAMELETTDIEQAIADRMMAAAADGTGASAAAATAPSDSIDGTSTQFVLALDFISAFTGCSKEIVYRRRMACQLCSGSGSRRKRNSRCGQCAGRGQLQLPSGSSLVTKSCALCLGSGSVLPPDCSSCKGTGLGALVDEKCTVHVAPGANDGDKIFLREKGNAGSRGGRSGHCIVTVLVKPHRIFNRDGSDLHVVIPVPLSVVLGGGSVDVPILDDEGRASRMSVPMMLNEPQHKQQQQQPFQYISNESPSFEEGGGDVAASSSTRPMVNERVILLPNLGMWRRPQGSPFSDRAEATLSRGSLYVHCVGVTPTVERLTKAQRAILVEHFFSPESAATVACAEAPREKDEEGKSTQKKRAAAFYAPSSSSSSSSLSAGAVSISEGDFVAAKQFCRHWLP